MKNLVGEKDARSSRAADIDSLAPERIGAHVPPAGFCGLFVGNLVTSTDERCGAVHARHVIQRQEDCNRIGASEVGEGRVAMKAAITDAVADPRRLRTTDHLDETEFRVVKQGFQHV